MIHDCIVEGMKAQVVQIIVIGVNSLYRHKYPIIASPISIIDDTQSTTDVEYKKSWVSCSNGSCMNEPTVFIVQPVKK